MVRWFQPALQSGVTLRDTDVMVCVPAKSGTTWTMNIVHQLFRGGDADFEDIYAEVPWIEFKERPDQTNEELYKRWDALPNPRAFKTHSYPNTSPGGCVDFRDDVKYVVVFRNPEEALVSFKPFLEAHSPELFELWDAKEMRDSFLKPSFQEFFDDIVLNGFPGMPPDQVPPGGLINMLFVGFINAWWPLRHKKNVLMLHYNDMKADHERSIRKIADFLEVNPTPEEWSRILEYTSFEWMKANQCKFEIPTLLPFRVIQEGGMVRKGASGRAYEDGMTPVISNTVTKIIEENVIDSEARKWMFCGDQANTANYGVGSRVVQPEQGDVDAQTARRCLIL